MRSCASCAALPTATYAPSPEPEPKSSASCGLFGLEFELVQDFAP